MEDIATQLQVERNRRIFFFTTMYNLLSVVQLILDELRFHNVTYMDIVGNFVAYLCFIMSVAISCLEAFAVGTFFGFLPWYAYVLNCILL